MKHVTDLIQAYLDDELSPSRRAVVEAHCAECAACARELEQTAAVWSAVDHVRTPELGRSLWPAIQRRRAGNDAGRLPSAGAVSFWRRLVPADLATAGLATGALAVGLAAGLLVGMGDLPVSGDAGEAVLVTAAGPTADIVTSTVASTVASTIASTMADESATLLANAGMTLTDLWVAAAVDEENEI